MEDGKCKMVKQIAAAGSNRQYIREQDASGRSIVRVVGISKEENHAFLTMARHFHQKGLPVPQVYSVSEDEMEYTQQDLGDTLLFDYIKHGRETGSFSPEEVTMLEKTIRALAHIQIEGAQGMDWSVCYPVERFNERSIRWDLNYFKYCFLKNTRMEFLEEQLENEFDLLTTRLMAEADMDAFLYRDCQSRNVMIHGGQPYFIDFQGGRRGPVYYDIASLLWQAKANLPASLREQLIEVYCDELSKISTIHFDRQCLQQFVLFRTLQVLGAYGYRGLFERKKHFIESIPFAIRNLGELLSGTLGEDYPYLKMLSLHLAEMYPQSERVVAPTDSALEVTVYSFSFKKGIPTDDSGNGGGYVFDCRSTHNPGKYEEYKQLTGLDQPVIDFLERDGEILTFLDSAWKIVDHHVERFMERGFSHMQVAFGCTGGQHRSVYSAEHTAQHIHDKYGVRVHLIHRERGIDRVVE